MGDFTLDELKLRVERLQQLLQSQGISVAVLNQNADLYYYTGSTNPLYLFVPAQGEPFMLARKGFAQIGSDSWMKLEGFANTKDLTRIMEKYGLANVGKIGLSTENTAYATVLRFRQLLGDAEVVDISNGLRSLRMVKSEVEIRIQARAGELIAQLPEMVREGFTPGMTELELSAYLEYHLRRKEHEILARSRREGIEVIYGVCAAGNNALAGTKFDGICSGAGIGPAFPCGPSTALIPRGIPVIMDYVFNYRGYLVDQTRMFSWGEPPQEARWAYEAMLRVEDRLIAGLKPGRTWVSLYEEAVQTAAELGYEKEFMGLGPEKVKFVGHGLGLELDEPPYLAAKMEEPLSAGMVLAIEPKVALPGLGVIGIEDTLVIRESGAELLTVCARDFIIYE